VTDRAHEIDGRFFLDAAVAPRDGQAAGGRARQLAFFVEVDDSFAATAPGVDVVPEGKK
jgi:hypothetical protein